MPSCIKEITPSHMPGEIRIKIEVLGLTRTIFPIRAEFVYLHEWAMKKEG